MLRLPPLWTTLLLLAVAGHGAAATDTVPLDGPAIDVAPIETAPVDPGADAGPAVLAFEHFIRRSGPLCKSEPSTRCVGEGWRYADSDGDGHVAIDELKAVRGALVAWTRWRGQSLPASERLGIHGGVWLIDTVGLDNLFASYDADGDAALTMAELLADVELDRRPLGAVLLDPAALDRQALSARLGKFAPMLGALLKPH